MIYLVYICLLFCSLASSSFSRDRVFMKKFIPLISDVHSHYGMPSVFFLSSRNNRRLEEYTFVHSLSRDFSRNGVLSVIINFEELNEGIKFYRPLIPRPLIVVLLRSMSDVEEFHINTRYMNTAYPIWLLIFAGKSGKPICEYCANPVGNILHLRFDTEMVVMCCEDTTINEWWSSHENHTDVGKFATWNGDKGIEVLTPNGLYARRHDANGADLRIAFVAEKPALSNTSETITDCYFGGVLMELKRAMNFTMTKIFPVESYGSVDAKTNKWTGIVGHLARREADIGVAEFTITNSRLDVIDFTLPLLLTGTKLFIKQPDGSGVQWSAYFQAFTWEIWMTIILLLIISSILLTLIKIKESQVSATSLIAENYLCVWGLFCQQGLFNFPVETPLRIACFSILVSALVVFTAYSASLTSFLTVSSTSLPFASLLGFVKDGSYKLILIQNSSNYDLFTTSSDKTLKKMTAMMKPWTELPKTFKEGFHQVCNEKVAFYTNTAVKQLMNRYITCKIVSIDTERVDSLAIATAKDSQYNGALDYHLQRFQDDGTLSRLKQKYLTIVNPTDSTYLIVSLWGVAPILSVLAGGIVLAVVVLVFEKICCSVKKYAHKWDCDLYSQNLKMHKELTIRGKKRVSYRDRQESFQRRNNY